MPALLPVPNAVKIQCHWTIGGDTSAQTHFFWAYTGSAPSSNTCILLGQAIGASIQSRFLPLMHPTVLAEGVTVTDLSGPSGGQGFAVDNHPGTRTGGDLPAANCCLVNGVIARRYRGGKPRFYLPWGTASDVQTGQTWTSAALTAFQAGINNFQTDVSAITQAGTNLVHPVNISYYAGFYSVQDPVTKRYRNIPTPRSAPLVDQILSLPINPKFGTQRRRNLHST